MTWFSRYKTLNLIVSIAILAIAPTTQTYAVASLSEEQLIAEAKKRCLPPTDNEPFVYANDFKWGQSLQDIMNLFDKLYKSDKKLQQRAFYSPSDKKFILPYQQNGKEIPLTEKFIKSITLHIEKALEKQYADAVFFSDMGHAHLFIPNKYYEKELSHFEYKDFDKLYEKIFMYKGTKFLYHTAEQLKINSTFTCKATKFEKNKVISEKDNRSDAETKANKRYLIWRYATRNLLGDNKALGHIEIIHNLINNKSNTASELKGYKYWGAGFSIHSSKNGCFPYKHKGKILYFDLSLSDLPYKDKSSDF